MKPSSRRIAAWAVFIIGFFLMFFGIILLLRSTVGLSRISIIQSFLYLIIGLVLAFLAIRLSQRPIYIFFAYFALMVGFFVTLAALKIISQLALLHAWPLISVFSGIALLPAGWRHYGAPRVTYIVPSCVFVALGLVLLIFSFDIVTFSFKQFILDWWPLLLTLTGIVLALFSLGLKRSPGDNDK